MMLIIVIPLLIMYKWFADVMDGAVARGCGRVSALGGSLDTAADIAFNLISIVILCNLLFDWRVWSFLSWSVAIALTIFPWALMLVVNRTPDVLSDHGLFKNGDNIVNYTLWVLAENSFVCCAALSALYVVLSMS